MILPRFERLRSPKVGLDIVYCPIFGINQAEAGIAARLSEVERTYGVSILYGWRRFGEARCEVVLVDCAHMRQQQATEFTYYLWRHFQIDVARYEFVEEFARAVRAGQPIFAAVQALIAGQGGRKILIAHDWLGLPTALAAILNEPGHWRTAYYAHEMPTARILAEDHPGHDTRFYNALFRAREAGLSMDDVFGNRDDFFKHMLLKRALACDEILAVGDLVLEELRFMRYGFEWRPIRLVYNGVPGGSITVEEKLQSRRLLQDYTERLLGYRPDYIFTHVARLVISKGLWRDLRVMEHVDRALAARGRSGVLFLLTTAIPQGRRSEDIWRWEREYGWPVKHRADNGDLIGPEIPFYVEGVQRFNAQARASRVVLVNQFGWSRERCGERMPAEMSFVDLRRGSDLEFGQSIYEPFGIAQLEPLAYGALCVPGNICGCLGFVNRITQGRGADNIIIADYTTPPPHWSITSVQEALAIDQQARDQIEIYNSAGIAHRIMQRLPADAAALGALIQRGEELSRAMSWEVVVRDYLLPALGM
ncbi:MAG: hypothetical protein KatS3mg057_3195 [Herpetosiphonaceae bacterium]|nr:MAG: hypothetical protein KatS3mg057_3195 [Herpetosiphonaceae bacterium]